MRVPKSHHTPSSRSRLLNVGARTSQITLSDSQGLTFSSFDADETTVPSGSVRTTGGTKSRCAKRSPQMGRCDPATFPAASPCGPSDSPLIPDSEWHQQRALSWLFSLQSAWKTPSPYSPLKTPALTFSFLKHSAVGRGHSGN